MQWWNDFVTWLNSDEGSRIVSTAILPFIAIVLAGVIGSLLGRGSTRRLLVQQDRELQAAAVAAMIDSGRYATQWSSLATGAQEHAESEFRAADIRLRLLPVTGASAAADWATHELKAMRRDSANFSFQADQTYTDYRDRLLEWQRRPGRARKLFALDLERFRFEDQSADTELVEQQRRWAAEQAAVAQEEHAEITPTWTPATGLATASAVSADAVVAEPAAAEPVVREPIVVEPVVVESVPAEPVAVDQASSDQAEEPFSADPTPVDDPAPAGESDPQPEPHVESEEDPEDELEGVEIAEPVTHEPEYSEWEGQPTQAMPLIEPSNPYSSATSQFTGPVTTTPRNDDERDN